MRFDGLVFYPVNPILAARLRQAFVPSGAKDDQPDADLLLDILTRHRDHLRPLMTDTPQTRTLQLLVEERRKLVEGLARKPGLTKLLRLSANIPWNPRAQKHSSKDPR